MIRAPKYTLIIDLLIIIFLSFATRTANAVISVDDSSVPRVSAIQANFIDLTTGSFIPPANALLLVMVSADAIATADTSVVVTDTQNLSWHKIGEADPGSGTSQSGHASAWYASTATSTSMTVSVRRTSQNGGTNRLSFKVYIVTGHDLLQPIGASFSGGATSDNVTSTLYLSTVDNSRAFGVVTDWNATGLPTSSDVEDAADHPSEISTMSVYKSADTATAATAVSVNFDPFGAGLAELTYVAFEVRPSGAPSSTCSSPAGISGQLQWISGDSKIKYCSSGNWIDTSHSTGASCVGTTAGTINYSSGDLRYCNGTNWISMKGSRQGSCSGTTAGTSHFSENTYRICDGTNWFQMGPSEIAFRQLQEQTITANTNTISTGAFTSSTNQSNLLICWLSYNSATESVSSISDTHGNTYAKAAGPLTGTGSIAGYRQEIWYAANINGGSGLDVTATLSSTFNASKDISCHEYSGAATSSPIDQVVETTGSGANATTANMTTTSANQMIFSAVIYQGTGTGGPGHTQRSSLHTNCSQDRIVGAAGSYNASFTNLGGETWAAQAISVRSQ
ncbi:MAG: hypothetical protein IPJ71_03925 [Bdellovibrionales bacterium]|nr:hypothetical protein [Bdellovibrionales bacterium]